MMRKIELLAPAGDFEKLQMAIAYGADAVYLGGKAFSLRAKAKNFTYDDLRSAVAYAHAYGRKVYVAVNIFARNEDFLTLENYVQTLCDVGADAVIVSDPGVFQYIKHKWPAMEIHISTQANNTNYESVRFWQSLGAKRVILARELSLREITEIREKVQDIELEAFVHGAMCVSYSGRCLLSLYFTGRDGNRGACAHPCRYKYALMEETRPGVFMPIEEDERGTYILDANDLCMVEHIPALIRSGLDSFKLEGRMKSGFYTAAVTRTYRTALEDAAKDETFYNKNKPLYIRTLRMVSSRDFGTGFYLGAAASRQEFQDRAGDYLGVVISYDEQSGWAVIEQRNKFSVGERLAFFTVSGEDFTQTIAEIVTDDGASTKSVPHPRQRVKIKTERPVRRFDILWRDRARNSDTIWD